jgi:hypothetical protein
VYETSTVIHRLPRYVLYWWFTDTKAADGQAGPEEPRRARWDSSKRRSKQA